VTDEKVIALTATAERRPSTASGYAMLIVLVAAILGDVFGIQRTGGHADVLGFGIITVATLVFILVMPGFTCCSPTRPQR
jgi:hypothetical protein